MQALCSASLTCAAGSWIAEELERLEQELEERGVEMEQLQREKAVALKKLKRQEKLQQSLEQQQEQLEMELDTKSELVCNRAFCGHYNLRL